MKTPFSRIGRYVMDCYCRLLFRRQQRRGDLLEGWSGVAILLYHDVCPYGDWSWRLSPRMTTTPEVFARQIDWLSAHMQIGTIDEALRRIRLGQGCNDRLAVISSDDGWLGFWKYGGTVLRAKGVSSVVYIATAVLENKPAWFVRWSRLLATIPASVEWSARRLGIARPQAQRVMKALTQRDLREVEGLWREAVAEFGCVLVPPGNVGYVDQYELEQMMSAGVTIGAHTVHHVALSKLPLDQAKVEIEESRRHLENLTGARVQHFAYPYGAVNEDVAKMMDELGWTSAVTTQFGWNYVRDNPYLLRRIVVSDYLTVGAHGDFSEAMFWAVLTGRWERVKQVVRKIQEVIRRTTDTRSFLPTSARR